MKRILILTGAVAFGIILIPITIFSAVVSIDYLSMKVKEKYHA